MTHFTSSDAIHDDAFQTNIKNSNINHFINSTILDFAVTTYKYIQHKCHRLLADGERILHMNATIALLQFWTADLDLVTLGRATEEVYTAFFFSSAHTLYQQSNNIVFGHFVITLNATFYWQLLLADEGYENDSDTINLPTLLRETPRIHDVSSIEHA